MQMSSPTEAISEVFDGHPIHEEQIIKELLRDGVSLDGLTEDILKEYDHDNYGGAGSVDILIRKAGIKSHHNVLDVCSGFGGPARYLASQVGCHVTGIDVTKTRHATAVRLTELVNLSDQVAFQHGDALNLTFKDESFDVVMSQESFAHVPNKPLLICECARVLRPGGRLIFTDIVATPTLTTTELTRLQEGMAIASLETCEGYVQLAEQAGCTVIEHENLGAFWLTHLRIRLQHYRDLKEMSVQKNGADHYDSWDDTYAFYVSLYEQGKLQGVRLVAQKHR